jgi:hypothetical protein
LVGWPSSFLALRVSAMASSRPSASTSTPLSPACPPPSGIEHGAVEHDAGVFDAHDAGFTGAQVRVGAEQVVGHAAMVAAMPK